MTHIDKELLENYLLNLMLQEKVLSGVVGVVKHHLLIEIIQNLSNIELNNSLNSNKCILLMGFGLI